MYAFALLAVEDPPMLMMLEGKAYPGNVTEEESIPSVSFLVL